MAVHIYGLPVYMPAVLDLANRYGLKVIEDAAQAIGQDCGGRPCGSFGDISVFSFYPNKHITTGEGGMVVTDCPDLAGRSRDLRNLCFMPGRRFVHEELGWNYRMTNLQAALGCAQLEQLDLHVRRKREIGALYNELLEGVAEIQKPLPRTEYADNIYWVYGIVMNCLADRTVARLGDLGIGTRPFFWPMHEQPVFQRLGLFGNECYPVSERIGRNGFYLPSGLGLQNAEICQVADGLKGVLV
jgi:perosamine synthetase